MQFQLSQSQRLVVATIYIAVMWGLYGLTINHIGSEERAALWFSSGALMVILGRYVVEPFYTTPADAIVNSIALLVTLLLLGEADSRALIGAQELEYYGYSVMAMAIIAIFLKDRKWQWAKRGAPFFYRVAEILGKSQLMFSVLYILVSYSYVARAGEWGLYISLMVLWICLTFFDVAGKAIYEIGRVFTVLTRRTGDELGEAIGCDNPLLYKVEVDYTIFKGAVPEYGALVAIETKTNVGSIGMVVNRKHLLGKSWLSVYLLTDDSGQVLKLDLRGKKLIDDPQSVFASTNKVFLLRTDEDLSPEALDKTSHNPLYSGRNSFVGFITRDSNINTVSFIILRDQDSTQRTISEGVILKTAIYGQDTLYQVINGSTREEHLQALDSHGYTVGVARKLGRYNQDEYELETRRWMPRIYAPLFFGYQGEVTAARKTEIARDAIGRLPETDLEVRLKDINALVTHNTAILGILGIGKSCLAYELMKKVSATGVKIVCIDITNEYKKELPAYIAGNHAMVSDDENAFNVINGGFGYIHVEDQKQVPDRSGNYRDYKDAVKKDLCQFFFGQDTVPDQPTFEATKKIRIFNVDYHKASRGEKIGFNVLAVEMTQAEKTRVIAEELFKILMKIPLEEEKVAKVLLVFEEAHSLIPEWNSVASDGDKNATNGTAKVILQGRKYGLGSLVVTQRTANVSKSILNQCNTVFALRVFDDTGKQFLENYIGQDYAETLPTLEERHAIAIGKGVRLKQPVIIQLNDKDSIANV